VTRGWEVLESRGRHWKRGRCAVNGVGSLDPFLPRWRQQIRRRALKGKIEFRGARLVILIT
jgi:hypothetical protein